MNSQELDSQCKEPPRIDPRACCDISKKIDKSAFPECFDGEQQRKGSGGTQSFNRQRRAAYGGGGHWGGHHGHAHFPDFHGHGSNFNGNGGFHGNDDNGASFHRGGPGGPKGGPFNIQNRV